jgi:hypothetical protein
MRFLRGILCLIGFMGPVAAASLISADFNGDGYLDLARVAPNAGLCVLLSNGDGTYQPPVCYRAGPAPISILTGDLNGDGNLDLLALNPDRGPLVSGIAVLLGNGDGTFQASERLYPAGANPRLFSLADFNGDGSIDVGVVGLQGPCVLLGQGDGTLGQPLCVSIRGFSTAHTLFTADVDGNGTPDFVGVSSNTICVWNRMTREPRCTPTRLTSRLAVIGDFTADGVLDVALVGSAASNNVACVYSGDGAGGFDLSQCTLFRAMANLDRIDSADLNLDTIPDLALAGTTRARGEAVILLGNGKGGFEASAFEVPIAPVIDGLAITDFNADGNPDLAITGSGRLCLLAGDGAGGFGEPQCSK